MSFSSLSLTKSIRRFACALSLLLLLGFAAPLPANADSHAPNNYLQSTDLKPGEDATGGNKAVSGNCGTDDGQLTEENCQLLKDYINPAINLLTGLVGIVAVISLILAGINYSMSEGDPQKAGNAKGRIVKTVVGLVAYAFLYAFLQFLIPGGAF